MSLKNDFFIISFAVIRRFGSTLKMFCRRSRVAWSMSRGNFMSPWMACYWIIIGSSISLNGNPLQKLRSKELLTVNIAHIAKCQSSRYLQQNCSHDLTKLQGLYILMYHNWLLSWIASSSEGLWRNQSQSTWYFPLCRSSYSPVLCLCISHCISPASPAHKVSTSCKTWPSSSSRLCQAACSSGSGSPSKGLGQEDTRK